MFKYELKKYTGVIFTLVCMFGIAYFLILVFNHSKIEASVRGFYNEYMNILAGPLNEEKEKYIAEEYQRVNLVIEQANANVESWRDFEKLDYALQHETAWNMIYDRYLNMVSLENASDCVFYDDLEIKNFFKNSRVNYPEIFLLTVIALYSVTVDLHEKRHAVIKSAYRGNAEYIFTKQNVIVCIAVFASAMFMAIEYLYIGISGNLKVLPLPIKSMTNFSKLRWSIPVGEYIILRGAINIIWNVVTMLVICLIGMLIKKLQTGVFISLFTIMLPLALKEVVNSKLFAWIYSVNLDKDFMLCSCNEVTALNAVILIPVIYTINICLWKSSYIINLKE